MPLKTLLVLPAFRESKRLPPFLRSLCDEIALEPTVDCAVLTVDDGSGPAESEAMQKVYDNLHNPFPFLLPPLLLEKKPRQRRRHLRRLADSHTRYRLARLRRLRRCRLGNPSRTARFEQLPVDLPAGEWIRLRRGRSGSSGCGTSRGRRDRSRSRTGSEQVEAAVLTEFGETASQEPRGPRFRDPRPDRTRATHGAGRQQCAACE